MNRRPRKPSAALLPLALLCACSPGTPQPLSQPYPALPLPAAIVIAADEAEAQSTTVRPHERLMTALGVDTHTVAVSKLRREPLAGAGAVVLVTEKAGQALSGSEQQLLLEACAQGSTLVLEGVSELARKLGFSAAAAPVEVGDAIAPGSEANPIRWNPVTRVTPLVLPRDAKALELAHPSGQPLAASLRHGSGTALVLASALDPADGRGYGRYPLLPQALLAAGLKLPVRSPRLDAFFDHGYREEADLEALARRWHALGIRAVHVGAWDFWEPDRDLDAYLRKLITAAHSHGIVVYAWLELPHVSPRFWDEHPAWREKTATGVDAHLDWRQLMNLRHPDCARAVHAGLEALVRRFDWDGINLAELYFESPSGASSPATLTPFNAQVRTEYRGVSGLDPLALLDERSPHFWKKDPAAWSRFVEWRVDLERRLNEEYLQLIDELRRKVNPGLGLALTYVDNLYDKRMREAIGADVSLVLPLLEKHDFTLIIEDPGSLWQLGPERYTELAGAYAKLTNRMDRLSVDINIVDRGPPVFPTARQTGGELAQLLHHAGRSFDRVMIYAEQTLLDQDAELVQPALSAGASVRATARGLEVKTRVPLVYRAPSTPGSVLVDGQPWPAVDGSDIWLPAGEHVLSLGEGAASSKRVHLLWIGGLLLGARYGDAGLELRYRSEARCFARLDRPPTAVAVDGKALPGPLGATLALPRGEHVVTVSASENP